MTVTHSRRSALTTVGSLFLATSAIALPPKPVYSAPAAAMDSLFVLADIVWGGRNLTPEMAPERSCVISSRYARNSQLVWRARIIDPNTGDAMTDQHVESAGVILGNGETLPMKFGAHPGRGEPTDAFWATSWVVPKEFPTGSLSYRVVATALDGRQGEFWPFNVASSMLMITDEVLPDLAP